MTTETTPIKIGDTVEFDRAKRQHECEKHIATVVYVGKVETANRTMSRSKGRGDRSLIGKGDRRVKLRWQAAACPRSFLEWQNLSTLVKVTQ